MQDADRVVSFDEGQAFARDNAMLFIECSAFNKTGVHQAFLECVHKLLDKASAGAAAGGKAAKASSSSSSSSAAAAGGPASVDVSERSGGAGGGGGLCC